MKKNLIICVLLATLISLTACGEITKDQEEKWNNAIIKLEELEKTLDEKVKETTNYYNSIDDDFRNEMTKIDFSLYKVEKEEFLIPEKDKEFDNSYDKLNNRIVKINKTISEVPTIEKIKEEEQKIIKEHEKQKIDEEQRKEEQRQKELKQVEKNKPTQKENTPEQATQNENPKQQNNTSGGFTIGAQEKLIYTRYAESGAIITSPATSESAVYRYKKKCEACGYVDGGGTTTSSGTNTSFTCPECKNRQKIKIVQKSSYQ